MKTRLNVVCCLLTVLVCVERHLSAADSNNYNFTKVCEGTKTGLSHSGGSWDRYLSYISKYGNCTTIQENLEIVFLQGDYSYDMSFLESIREVNGYVLIYGNYFDYLSLKNLRLIRGRKRYSSRGKEYSLYISSNHRNMSSTVGLKEVHLTSLREILGGEILFEENSLLCHAETINWEDILWNRTRPTFRPISAGQPLRTCGECDESCSYNGKKYCWGSGPEMCQRITRFVCTSNCDHGCFGPAATQCCDEQCAGGCEGNKKNCWACRHFTNDGVCVDKCPPEQIYSEVHYRYDPNPAFKYIYGSHCVKECPEHMLVDNAACVVKCADGFTYGDDRKCKPCGNGVCPKTCTSFDIIDKNNIGNFSGCTIIQGSLGFYANTFDSRHAAAITNLTELNVFENVEVINGYLAVQSNHPNITSLSFLKNLRVIYGQHFFAGKASMVISKSGLVDLGLSKLKEIANGDILVMDNSRLETLNLVSLERISKGSVAMMRNRRLCYADTINWTQIATQTGARVIVRDNANATNYCRENNHVCSPHCSSEGCWGPTDNACRSCADYKFEDTCVETCQFQKGLYADEVNGSRICSHCHEECLDNCTGKEPEDCLACRNVRDGPYCVPTCPPKKYINVTDGTCQRCFEHCKDGCTGPGDYLGPGGCSSCFLGRDLGSGKNVCLPEGSLCPDDFYSVQHKISYNSSTTKKTHTDRVDVCRQCHEECLSCMSSSTNIIRDACECRHFKHADYCVSTCPRGFFNNTNRECAKCHHECQECYGPSASECTLCKNVRYYDEDYAEPYGSWSENHLNESSSEDPELPNVSGSRDKYPPRLPDSPADEDANQNGTELPKGKFNCTAMCPEHLNRKQRFTVGNQEQDVCMAEPKFDPWRTTDEHKKGLNIVLPAVVGVVVVCLVAVLIVFLRRQWAKSEENKLRIEARMQGLDLEEMVVTPTDAKPDTSVLRLIKERDLRRGNEIGSGAFGTVYKGFWIPDGDNVKIPVAIKVLTETSNASLNVELLEEARIMASVSHPCCIRILAVCMTAKMMLITQLMPHGSLLDYLRKNRASIGSNNMLRWSAQIARGMRYLEEKGIVHRDLAARNVLVQGPAQVRITDFGLAKLLNYNEDQYQATGGKMPIKWLALESIQHRVFTHKSDVWSYGVTLWELFTYGDRPYETIRAVDISHHLEMGERLPQPQICTIDVYMIMVKCWMVDAESRPNFVDLENQFTDMTKDPGRYLVIQGDRFMRLQSVVEDAVTSPTDWFRSLSLPDEDCPQKLVTADEYLRPQDLMGNDFHPLGAARFLEKMSSINEEGNDYENCFKRTLSQDSESMSPMETSRFIDLEEAAATAKKFHASSQRDRKHSLRYTSEPFREENDFLITKEAPVAVAAAASGDNCASPVHPANFIDHKKNTDAKDLDMKYVITDESDYLQPRSTVNSNSYLDVVDDAGKGTKQGSSQHRGVFNPEYFVQSDPRSNDTVPIVKAQGQKHQQQSRGADDYCFATDTDSTPRENNNNYYNVDTKQKNPSTAWPFSPGPTYTNL